MLSKAFFPVVFSSESYYYTKEKSAVSFDQRLMYCVCYWTLSISNVSAFILAISASPSLFLYSSALHFYLLRYLGITIHL